MKLVTIHAVLLLAALAIAYQTWTAEARVPGNEGTVRIWSGGSDDVTAIRFATAELEVRLDRRIDQWGTYFWAEVTRTAESEPLDSDPIDSDLSYPAADGAEVEMAADGSATGFDHHGHAGAATTTTKVFVVGQEGEYLFRDAAAPRALRDLGTPGAEQLREYGLDEPSGTLVVETSRGVRELEVGGRVWAAGDPYMRDRESSRVFVLPREFMRRLEEAEWVLPERRIHGFTSDRIGDVSVRTAQGEGRMRRGDATATTPATWVREGAPDSPDQTFGGFMERLLPLWVGDFRPEVDVQALSHIVRLDYFAANGRPLGFLDLYRGTGADGNAEYLVVTELTRIPASIYDGAGEQLARDAAQLF